MTRNSGDENGVGLGGAFGRSRQTEIIKPTIQDAAINALVCVAFWLVAFGTLVALFIIVGPPLFWAVALVSGVWVFYQVYKWLAWFEPKDERSAAWLVFLMVVDGLLASACAIWWYFFYPALAESWPVISIREWVTFPLHGWAIPLAAIPVLILLVEFTLQGLHHMIEGFNPAAFQPFLAKRADTPWYYATGLPEDDESVGRDELIEALNAALRGNRKSEVIERLVVQNGNLHKTSSGMKGENGGLHTAQDQNVGPSYLYRKYNSGEAWMHAPDREYAKNDPALRQLRYIKVSDAARFIAEAETRGTSSRAWCPSVWKSTEHWHEVCDVLRRMGILEPPKNRSDSGMLVDKGRAMQILASWNTNCGDGETEIVEPFSPAHADAPVPPEPGELQAAEPDEESQE
jgi:hypothetical protein